MLKLPLSFLSFFLLLLSTSTSSSLALSLRGRNLNHQGGGGGNPQGGNNGNPQGGPPQGGNPQGGHQQEPEPDEANVDLGEAIQSTDVAGFSVMLWFIVVGSTLGGVLICLLVCMCIRRGNRKEYLAKVHKKLAESEGENSRLGRELDAAKTSLVKVNETCKKLKQENDQLQRRSRNDPQTVVNITNNNNAEEGPGPKVGSEPSTQEGDAKDNDHYDSEFLYLLPHENPADKTATTESAPPPANEASQPPITEEEAFEKAIEESLKTTSAAETVQPQTEEVAFEDALDEHSASATPRQLEMATVQPTLEVIPLD